MFGVKFIVFAVKYFLIWCNIFYAWYNFVLLFASAKTRDARRASPHTVFMGNCPTISHMC